MPPTCPIFAAWRRRLGSTFALLSCCLGVWTAALRQLYSAQLDTKLRHSIWKYGSRRTFATTGINVHGRRTWRCASRYRCGWAVGYMQMLTCIVRILALYGAFVCYYNVLLFVRCFCAMFLYVPLHVPLYAAFVRCFPTWLQHMAFACCCRTLLLYVAFVYCFSTLLSMLRLHVALYDAFVIFFLCPLLVCDAIERIFWTLLLAID